MRALQKLIQKELEAKNFGFDWPNFQMIIDQAIDECREIQEVIDLKQPKIRLQEEIGDLLHSAISMCLFAEIDIEETFENTYKKFEKRIKLVKQLASIEGHETLKNQPLELLLELWHKAKSMEDSLTPEDNITLRNMVSSDINMIVEKFASSNWHKPVQIFENYLQEQAQNQRLVKLAFFAGEFAGYATLKYHSDYQYFARDNIPEIKDLNVLPNFRRKGIASKLIEELEIEACNNNYDIIGIGVGLYADYGAAQNLYIRKNYKPDSNGIIYNDKQVRYGENIILDDDLTLMFIKKLNSCLI